MGRFETTARTYAARREPYPPSFFAAAADALKLNRREALIDLGTGPGVLALGFAPYVGCVVGVDPEPLMLVEARRAAAAAKINLPVIEGRAEDLPADVGSFHVITIGRALHWLDREATLAAIDRILAPGGRILICGSTTVPGQANPWRSAYDATLRLWGESRDPSYRRLYEHWFDSSRFEKTAEISVGHSQDITPEALVERALTRSTTSPAILGPRLAAFRVALLEALAPFFPDQIGLEVVEARAVIFTSR